MAPLPRPQGPWYGRFPERLAFERGAQRRVPGLRGRHSRRPGSRGWYYRLTMPVEGFEARVVYVFFDPSNPKLPKVYVDGPEPHHRYSDGSLCMWYPKDTPDQKWSFPDGLEKLLAFIAVHLFKEAWWREHDEWLGDEAPHGPEDEQDQTHEKRAA